MTLDKKKDIINSFYNLMVTIIKHNTELEITTMTDSMFIVIDEAIGRETTANERVIIDTIFVEFSQNFFSYLGTLSRQMTEDYFIQKLESVLNA